MNELFAGVKVEDCRRDSETKGQVIDAAPMLARLPLWGAILCVAAYRAAIGLRLTASGVGIGRIAMPHFSAWCRGLYLMSSDTSTIASATDECKCSPAVAGASAHATFADKGKVSIALTGYANAVGGDIRHPNDDSDIARALACAIATLPLVRYHGTTGAPALCDALARQLDAIGIECAPTAPADIAVAVATVDVDATVDAIGECDDMADMTTAAAERLLDRSPRGIEEVRDAIDTEVKAIKATRFARRAQATARKNKAPANRGDA